MNKQQALAEAWILSQKYPAKTSAILSKLRGTFDISVDEFNAYDSTMVANRALGGDKSVASDKFADIPGFSQSENMSDDEILRIFQAKEELEAKKVDIGSPPTEAEWWKAGLTAEQRIEKLRPFYEVKKSEEWEQLESPLPGLGFLTGPVQFLTELVGAPLDHRFDFKEELHERGPFTSFNPLTGFGAWDIAEFNVNPRTGESGFSSELLAMEDELEALYGTKRQFMEQYREGGFGEVGGIDRDLASLNQIITENKLLPPETLGER